MARAKSWGDDSGGENDMPLNRVLNIIGQIISVLGTLLMLWGGIDAFIKIRPADSAWRPRLSQAIFGDRKGGYIQVGTKGAIH